MYPRRILIVGSDAAWSIERIYVKYLIQRGIETKLFAAQNMYYNYYSKGLFNRVVFRAGLSNIYKEINKLLLDEVAHFNPNLIWVFKGMEILPTTLDRLRSMGILLVNYNPDSPFHFSGKGSGNVNVSKSIQKYDAYFTYDNNIRFTLQEKYNVKAPLLPFGFDLNDSQYEEICYQDEILSVCFVGNPDQSRVLFLEKLADEIPIHVYGNNWTFATRHPSILSFPPVYGNDFWKVIHKYRVQLNLLRPHNLNSHNMRSFEIPGAGGLGLYPNTPDHFNYFACDSMVEFFDSVEECISSAKKMLQLSRHETVIRRQNARHLSFTKSFDYFSRTCQFLQSINEL